MLKRLVLNTIRPLVALIIMLVVPVTHEVMAAESGASLSPEARQAMGKGLTAAKSQDYRLAIRHFEEARKIAPYAPELLFNLGLAESRTSGRELAAMVWLKAYLAVSPNSPEAQKVRSLYSQLEATTEGTIKKLIDLKKEVAGKLPSDTDRDSAFWYTVFVQARMGDFAGARQSAELAGKKKGYAYDEIATHLAQSGDIQSALKTAELGSDKAYTYCEIARCQGKTGDVAGALQTIKSAGRWDRCIPNNLIDDILGVQVKQSDIAGAMKTVEIAGMDKKLVYKTAAYVLSYNGDVKGAMTNAELAGMDKKFLYENIVRAQVRKGDVKDIMMNAERAGMEKNYAYGYMAEAQAKRGDIKAALKTAELARDLARGLAYGKIADAQVLKGDIVGARKSAALSNNPYYVRKVEIVSALLNTGNRGNLQERVNVLLDIDRIFDALNSPKYSWFTDLPAYLKSLNAISEPKKIVQGIDSVLSGDYNSSGGMIGILGLVKDLGKTDG